MSETTLVRDPKLVNVVNKLKTGKIETEIGYAQVGLVILLGILYVAITIPIVLLFMKLVQNEGGVFTMVYAIMGLTSSAIAMDIMHQPECESSVKDSDKNYATMSIIGYIILLLTGSFFTFKKYPKLGEVFKKKNA